MKDRGRHDASARAAVSTDWTLAEERGRHDASAWAAALAECTLAEERSRHDASARATALAELALAEERHRHTTAAQAAESAALALADERRRHEAAARPASLAEPELADDCISVPPADARPLAVAVRRNTAGVFATAAPAPPNCVPVAIWRIQAAGDTLAAPLDALLAEFEALAVNPAPPTTTSPFPPSTLTPPPRPRTYLDAVVGPSGRGSTLLATPSPPSALARTSPTIRAGHRVKPRRRTGRRNGPRAPSPPGEDTPSHPTRLMGGSPAMAQASHHPAALGKAGGTSSTGGIAHPSPVHGLNQPRTTT
jgi:hypothetical protein